MGGPAGIPFSEFYLWAYAHNFSRTDLTDLWESVHRYDEIWLDEQALWQKSQSDQKVILAHVKCQDAKLCLFYWD